MPTRIVAALGDLIFTVKISDAAKRAGVAVEFVKTADQALERAGGAAAMILDLNYVPDDLIVRLKSAEATSSIPLIGFVSHVQTDVIRHAKESGCDTVMARSAFVHKLAEMMQGFAVQG
jgi:hypothetical protein